MRAAVGRVRWSLMEGLVIAAILGAWLLVRLVVEAAIHLVDVPVAGGPARVLAGMGDAIAELVVPLALANVALYVTVRAGSILVDRHAARQ